MPEEYLADRLTRERKYYEEVFRESAALQRRLRHVFNNPNIDWAESLHAAISQRQFGPSRSRFWMWAWRLHGGVAQTRRVDVTGIDLSESAIAVARTRALAHASFLTCDAHCLPWSEPIFDVVVGRAILHHLDIDLASKN